MANDLNRTFTRDARSDSAPQMDLGLWQEETVTFSDMVASGALDAPKARTERYWSEAEWLSALAWKARREESQARAAANSSGSEARRLVAEYYRARRNGTADYSRYLS